MIFTPTYQLTDSFHVAAPQQRTWQFFSDAKNLARITPPQMQFTISPQGQTVMREGALIEYTIRILKLPIRWRTLIVAWKPPHAFEDIQLNGPYAQWHHRHTFKATNDGTLCEDRVLYRLPGGLLGRAVHAAFVRRKLVEIFRFRRETIGELLGPVIKSWPDARIERL